MLDSVSAFTCGAFKTGQTGSEVSCQNRQVQGYVGMLVNLYAGLCAVNRRTIILMWLRPANRYVRKLKAYRLARLMEQTQYQQVYAYHVVQPGYYAGQQPGGYNPNTGRQS